MHLSFVLLAAPARPDFSAISAAYARLFPEAPPITASTNDETESKESLKKLAGGGDRSAAPEDVIELERAGAPVTFVALMPAPVPNREADEAVPFSLSSFARAGFTLAPHQAHFLVTSMTLEGEQGIESLALHTRLVAAIASAHDALAIYEGPARATHAPKFYVDIARSMDTPLMLWTGLSIVRPNPQRVEILTLGLGQLGIPNMLVVAPGDQGDEALPFLLDLAGYVARRGEPIGDGETVGRSEEEKLVVRYVPSPIDPSEKVARIELP